MKIHLRQIPDDGARIEGEEPAETVLALDPAEPVRALGPVRYALDVGKNADGVWAIGEVGVDLELQCVRCLESFVYPLSVNDLALQVERPATETVDLTPQVREDILLALPAYPHCDWSGERVCPNHPPAAASVADSLAAADDSPAAASAWKTLDELDLGPKKKR